MSLQFIIGGSGSGKTRTLYENLIRQSMEEPDGRFFALVPEKVLKDVIEKKVSVEAAKKDYGVVVVSDGVHYQVDEQATKALRG